MWVTAMTRATDPRRAELLRQLAQRHAALATAPQRARQTELAAVLDAVDAWGKLAQLTEAKALRTRCFGPQTRRGLEPSPWVGVVVWCRGRGYYGYRQIELIGLWASSGDDDAPLLTLGTKPLHYSAPSYVPEAYFKLMRSSFDAYYDDDGSLPSPENRRLSIPYLADERLTIRQTIRAVLDAWLSAAAQ